MNSKTIDKINKLSSASETGFEKVSYEQFRSCFLYEVDNRIKGYDDIKLPRRSTAGSAGYDFFAPYDFTLKPGETIVVPTGIRCNIKNGWFLALFPRSGFGFKTGYSLSNTVGIIDSDFYHSDNEGHIMVKLENNSPINKTLTVKKGQAFCQGIFLRYGLIYEDDATGIRNGGFGSTTE